MAEVWSENAEQQNQAESAEKRALREEDYELFKQWFTLNEFHYRKDNDHFDLNENYVYNFLTNDLSNEKVTPENVPVQEYDQLIIALLHNWCREISQEEVSARIHPEHKKVLTTLTNILTKMKSARELRTFMRENYQIAKLYIPLRYQSFNLDEGEMTGGFLEIHMNEVNGYRYERPKSDFRIYLNPKLEYVPTLTREIINQCQIRHIPLYLKMLDYSCEGVDLGKKRSDRIVIYTDKDNYQAIKDIAKELSSEHPEWTEGKRPPFLTAKIAPGVGTAENISEEQRKFASSFSDVRAKLFYQCFYDIAREIVLNYPDSKFDDKVTLIDAFLNIISRSMPELQGNKQAVDKLINILADENRDYRDARKENKLESLVRRAINEMAPSIYFQMDSSYLKQKMTEKLKYWSPKYDVDPDDLSRNFNAGSQVSQNKTG